MMTIPIIIFALAADGLIIGFSGLITFGLHFTRLKTFVVIVRAPTYLIKRINNKSKHFRTEPFFIYRDTLSFYRTQHFSSFSNAVIPKQHRQYHQEHCVLKSCIHHSHGNQPTPSVVPYETVKSTRQISFMKI